MAIALAKLDHPLKLETTKQPDGRWTLVATYPPCTSGAGDKQASLPSLGQHVSLAKIVDRLSE